MEDQVIGQPSNPIYQEPKTKSAKWLWILVILIIIGGLVFAYVRGIGPFANINNLVKSSPSPTPEITQSTPTPEASASPSVDRASAKVRVLNGSGTTGKAATVKAYLETAGWKVTSIGNAENSDFAQTEVSVKDTFKSFEDTIISDLSGKYSASAGSKVLEASDSADIEVTVGAK